MIKPFTNLMKSVFSLNDYILVVEHSDLQVSACKKIKKSTFLKLKSVRRESSRISFLLFLDLDENGCKMVDGYYTELKYARWHGSNIVYASNGGYTMSDDDISLCAYVCSSHNSCNAFSVGYETNGCTFWQNMLWTSENDPICYYFPSNFMLRI